MNNQDAGIWTDVLRRMGYTVYPASMDSAEETFCAMVRGSRKLLAVSGKRAGDFAGERADGMLLCSPNRENADALMRLFPYTAPARCPKDSLSMGLGDRLGIATPGHASSVAAYDVFPVFAQQSVRELNLTGRTFKDIVAAAAFGVFEAGYKKGYGADGDHLKTIGEIDAALDAGCAMITLDCSNHIHADIAHLEDAEVERLYGNLPEDLRTYYESRYSQREHPVVGKIERNVLRRIVLTFHEAVEYAKTCHAHIMQRGGGVDFELSIDETSAWTLPCEHYVIANELEQVGVRPTSVAPHFCGEFEKGIDYRGDLAELTRQLIAHQQLAEHFGYKLSLHSGSDKFSVFPVFGSITKRRAHLKTAGTSWLEAMRVVAQKDPALYRRVHAYALEAFDKAREYYHVTTELDRIPDLSDLADGELPLLFQMDDARQLIHITYGLILNE